MIGEEIDDGGSTRGGYGGGPGLGHGVAARLLLGFKMGEVHRARPFIGVGNLGLRA